MSNGQGSVGLASGYLLYHDRTKYVQTACADHWVVHIGHLGTPVGGLDRHWPLVRLDKVGAKI